jgi:hypothetical protein
MGRWLDRTRGALQSLWRVRRAERELSEEFQDHIEWETQAQQRRGLSPDAARRAALLAMGTIETSKEDCREQRTGQRVVAAANRVRYDVRFALRLFRRNPAPIGIAVTGLALAIGIATAVFSVVNAVTLRGDGVVDRDELFRVNLSPKGSQAAPWRHADFVRLQQAHRDLPLVASDWYAGSFSGRPPANGGRPRTRACAASDSRGNARHARIDDPDPPGA